MGLVGTRSFDSKALVQSRLDRILDFYAFTLIFLHATALMGDRLACLGTC